MRLKKVLDLKPIKKLMGDDIFSQIFDEPVWVGTHEVLAHANLGDGFLIGEYRLNLRTGKVRQFRLNPQINDCKPAHWALSPDRKRILWLQGHLDNSSFTIYSARLDGSGSESWKSDVRSDDGDLRWMPDGHRFVCFQWSYRGGSSRFVRALIYDAAAPNRKPLIIKLPTALQCAYIIGFLPDGSLLTANNLLDGYHGGGARKTVLIAFRLNLPAKSARKFIVRMPNDEGCHCVQLSPDGKSLAWTVNSGDDNKKGVSLWISRTDGSQMHRIGAVPGALKGWYPNSRALLFEADDFESHPHTMELFRVDPR